MADIFISYARQDRSRAEQLASAMAAKGWTVWWDRRIQVGKSFSRVIEAELDAARCVLVLWSGSAVESEWVLAEAAEGTRRGVLVPARIEDVRIPLEFRRLQTADLTHWQPGEASGEFEACLSAIGSLVEQSAAAPTAAPKAATHEPPPPEPSPPEPRPRERPVRQRSTTIATPEPSPVAEVAPRPRRWPNWLPVDVTFTRTLVLGVLAGIGVLLVIVTLIQSAWQEFAMEPAATTTADRRATSTAATTTTTSSTPPVKQAATRIVDFETTVGIISFRLGSDLESDQLTKLIDLGQTGFFDEMSFQRSPNGLIIKGYDLGSANRGLTSERAYSKRRHMKGTLSIPHSRNADLGKQQFFICLSPSPPPGLDAYFEVIGVLDESDMKTIDRILDALSGNQPVVLRSVKFR